MSTEWRDHPHPLLMVHSWCRSRMVAAAQWTASGLGIAEPSVSPAQHFRKPLWMENLLESWLFFKIEECRLKILTKEVLLLIPVKPRCLWGQLCSSIYYLQCKAGWPAHLVNWVQVDVYSNGNIRQECHRKASMGQFSFDKSPVAS